MILYYFYKNENKKLNYNENKKLNYNENKKLNYNEKSIV